MQIYTPTQLIPDASIVPSKLNGGQAGNAPGFVVRAFVNFNGVTTATIRASGNVSSVTRVGIGSYTVNFATAMDDANYCVVGGVGQQSYAAVPEYGTTKTASTCSVASTMLSSISGDNRQFSDNSNIHVAILR